MSSKVKKNQDFDGFIQKTQKLILFHFDFQVDFSFSATIAKMKSTDCFSPYHIFPGVQQDQGVLGVITEGGHGSQG